MKQWIAKIELVDDSQPQTFRARVSIRNRHGVVTTKETIYPKQSDLYKHLKRGSRPKPVMYALMRSARNRSIHFVREEAAQSW